MKPAFQLTKKQAFRAARRVRLEGGVCKILCHSGIYTQPGRGIAAYCYYTVQVAS